jgi:hypothetical protein
MDETVTSAGPRKKLIQLLDGALRHPVGAMLVGFLLTGVVGTMLSNHLADQRQQEADANLQREARRKAVLEFSRMMSEQVTRMEMLAAALEHHA